MTCVINGDTGVTPVGPASGVIFTPTGSIAASNVQAAIAELDTEKLALAGGTMTGSLNISNVGPQINFVETDASNKTYTLTSDAGKFFFRENGAGGSDRWTFDPAIGMDFSTHVRVNGASLTIKRNDDAGAASYIGFRNAANTLDAYVGYGSGGTAEVGLTNTIGVASLSGNTGVNFHVGGDNKFRINSGGQFYANGTNVAAYGNGTWTRSGTLNLGFPSGTGFGSGFVLFGYNNGAAGSITLATASSCAFNTTSDYRLKNDPKPLTGSGDFIDALQPKTWVWSTDGAKGVGFIAHEAAEVAPLSVTGEKDAVDDEGKPILQSMAYGSGEIIANLVAELQSLRRRVAETEAEIAALKGAK
jgi:Chaperone of endosialidase